MIGHIDDQSVILKIQLFQFLENHPHVVVEIANRRVVCSSRSCLSSAVGTVPVLPSRQICVTQGE